MYEFFEILIQAIVSQRWSPAVGRALAAAGRPLVYGGANLGLMGIVSDAVLGAGGKSIGVIPRAMITKGGEGENIPLARPVADNVKFTLTRKSH